VSAISFIILYLASNAITSLQERMLVVECDRIVPHWGENELPGIEIDLVKKVVCLVANVVVEIAARELI
jgi:hypothetical protein